jgi:hypothetical protein
MRRLINFRSGETEGNEGYQRIEKMSEEMKRDEKRRQSMGRSEWC